MKNIEGLFQAGLTDVDFPADTWSAMASRSSLGMEIAAQQAPVGSVAYALHEQNQLAMMLQASLSNMAPIRFGFGGFAQKSYPTYGPVMLGLGNLSRGNQTSETVQQVSKRSDPDLEEIYAALAKQTEGMDVGSPSSPGTYSVKEELTYEGMRKVLGGNGPGTPDGLALYAKSIGPSAKYVFDFFTEDIKTILDPEATAVEKAMAIGFTFFKPAKVVNKVVDAAGAAKNVAKVADAVNDVKSTGKAIDKGSDKNRPSWRQSEIDVEKDFPEYNAQKSFKDGKEVPYGEKGSSRPDLYQTGHSIEVKNYKITTSSGRSRLINNVSKQVEKRLGDLPNGTKQSVLIDIRGQNVSDEILDELYEKIMNKTNGKVDIRFKTN